MTDPDTRPLSGVKVLDFTQNLPGPYATYLLASWGAEVVKVEPPKGDPGRFMRPFFDMVNRGKKSVVLDLRQEASQPSLHALIRWADVIVEGFRPGVMTRLGADYEAARALREDIVYCSISGFGQDGPLRDHPGHDLNLQALSGVCHLERDSSDTPRGSMLPIADLSSSLLAVSGISAALLQRERSGRGTYLDVAMLDGALSFAGVWSGVDLTRDAEKQAGRVPLGRRALRPLLRHLDRARLYAMPHYGVFETRDGHVSIGIVDENHFWSSLCEELGLGRLKSVPLPIRIATGPVLRPLVARALKRRTTAEWMARFLERGVPASEALRPEEAARHPHVVARGLVDARGWIGSPLPGAGPVDADAPKRGAHTEEVLEALGVSLP